MSAARQLPAQADPVRAEAHALLDRLLDLLRAAPPPAPAVEGVMPLRTAAKALGWTPRKLRTYCLANAVPVHGRGGAAAVDLGAVRAALASQPRVKHDAPSREAADDINDWLKG